MLKPRIILAMPSHLGLINIISNNLVHHGFDVLCFDQMVSPEPFKYPNIQSRFYKGYRKIFYKDKDYKINLRNEINISYIERQLEPWGGYTDYTLVIRPDMFSEDVLALLKARTRNTFAGYQWDGLNRFPNVFSRIKLFDRFFVFDPQDYQDNNNARILPITNFCIDNVKLIRKKQSDNQPLEAYFVGYHNPSRELEIEGLVKALSEYNIDVKCFISHAPANSYNNLPITKIKEKIEFNDNLAYVQQTDILIDLVIGEHKGLSFRTFEALFFQKKLITNNSSIRGYDFYHPDNILIWDGQNMEELKYFLDVPYNLGTNNILCKYHFGNWIKYVLDLGEYKAISLPSLNKVECS